MYRTVGIVLAAAIALTACGGSDKAPTSPTTASKPSTAAASGPGDAGTPGSSPTPSSTNQVEIRGPIDTVTGTASAFQFNIGSRVVRGDAQTSFTAHGRSDSFGSLKEGLSVEIKGEQRTGFIQATRVNIEDDAPGADDDDDDADDNDNDEDDDDDPPNQDQSASIHGTLNNIAGTAPALLLNVGSTIVRTSAETTLKRKGDQLPLSLLRTGQSLHVVGTRQANGSIDARQIQIEDDNDADEDDDDDDVEFRTEGLTGPVLGACPGVRFTVSGTTIVTTALTRFDKITCPTLAAGIRVEVRGLRGSDGNVTATRVKRK